MRVFQRTIRFRPVARIGKITLLAATLFATTFPQTSQAQTEVSFQSEPLIVGNDRGGLLLERLRQLTRLSRESRPVQIRGNICFSTCTMYIGLPNTCVLPTTTFGFHGPSSHGRALSPATFDQASSIIADHYPPALREWYMETGRYRVNNMYRISGQNLINMGVRSC
ncbi:hypothetical protein [Thalassobium sp. R2A62]|uniref:hypothetical protein n=1 Tax=Thalassobium sp. R2A62 TaxID=633131 RepID=UPI0001B1D386|nr:hypothetical protein [Thalassobium sp. R2A62]EET48904.1 hypothetical protein TR2A62_1798 [Thalassobium sp. R2A62]